MDGNLIGACRTLLVGIIACQHVGFLVLEMFLWRKPVGLRTFRMTQEVADVSATLAANQGLYNGFLAAGLFFSLAVHEAAVASAFQTFFLGCVAVAGIFGAFTVSRRIFFVQALPALVALATCCCCCGQ